MSKGSKTGLDLLRADVEEIQHGLQSGDFTIQDLVEDRYSEVEANNTNGAKLRAVIEMPPKDLALARAKQLDEEINFGASLGPLHGTTMMAKDTFAVNTEQLGYHSMGGTFALSPGNHKKSAKVIDSLVSKGAIPIGAANLYTMSGMHGATALPRAHSARGGQTRSSFDPRCEFSSGSSHGSAQLVASGMADFALGAETKGSIVLPASEAGVYGYKPTRGLVPVDGVMPVSARFDTVGTFAKSAKTTAFILDAMVPDSGDMFTKALESGSRPLSSFKVGIFTTDGKITHHKDPKVRDELTAVFDDMVESLKSEGAQVVKLTDQDALDVADYIVTSDKARLLWHDEGGIPHTDRGYLHILATDMYNQMPPFLADMKDCPIQTLDDIYEWNENNPEKAFPPSGPSQQGLVRLSCETKGNTNSEMYIKSMAEHNGMGEKINQLMKKSGCNLLITHATGGLGPTLSACSGGPLASVPHTLLKTNNAPWGPLVLGLPHDDRTVLQFMDSWGASKLGSSRPVPDLSVCSST